MQFDPAPGPSEPFLHKLGVMIARVVEKDMDEREHRIKRLDRLQRRIVEAASMVSASIIRVWPVARVDRAVNIDPLTPARLFDCELLLFWRPAADRPRRMGRMHGIRKSAQMHKRCMFHWPTRPTGS